MAEPHVDLDSIKRHIQYQRDFPYEGTAAQRRFLANLRPPGVGEFAGIPALLLQVPGDVLVQESLARAALQLTFGSTQTVDVGGLHANLVERPQEYLAAIKVFLDRIILRITVPDS